MMRHSGECATRLAWCRLQCPSCLPTLSPEALRHGCCVLPTSPPCLPPSAVAAREGAVGPGPPSGASALASQAFPGLGGWGGAGREQKESNLAQKAGWEGGTALSAGDRS